MINRAALRIASVMGIFLGISSINHGICEVLQGLKPTGGLLIMAIAPGSSWTIWKEGGEGAFTLLPNFLAAGICSILAGAAAIVWSAAFLEKKHGASVFLLIFLCSFLSGGGVAQVLFFLIAWAVATRIHKPLNFWKKVLPAGIWSGLGKVWPWSLTVSVILFVFALYLAVFGFLPGVKDPQFVLYFCWTILASALAGIFLSIVSAFADDLNRLER